MWYFLIILTYYFYLPNVLEDVPLTSVSVVCLRANLFSYVIMSRSVIVSSCFGLGSRACFSLADTDGMLCKCFGGLRLSSPLLFNVNELGATVGV